MAYDNSSINKFIQKQGGSLQNLGASPTYTGAPANKGTPPGPQSQQPYIQANPNAAFQSPRQQDLQAGRNFNQGAMSEYENKRPRMPGHMQPSPYDGSYSQPLQDQIQNLGFTNEQVWDEDQKRLAEQPQRQQPSRQQQRMRQQRMRQPQGQPQRPQMPGQMPGQMPAGMDPRVGMPQTSLANLGGRMDPRMQGRTDPRMQGRQDPRMRQRLEMLRRQRMQNPRMNNLQNLGQRRTQNMGGNLAQPQWIR